MIPAKPQCEFGAPFISFTNSNLYDELNLDESFGCDQNQLSGLFFGDNSSKRKENKLSNAFIQDEPSQ